METVNIHDAKTRLSKLIAGVIAGKPFIIAKAGKPVAKVVPIEEEADLGPRKLGWLEGQYRIPDDWKAFAREEIEAMFYGEDDTGK